VQTALLTWVAELARARRLACRRREAGIAAPTSTAASCERNGAGPVEVADHEVAFPNDRSHRNVEGQIRTLVTGSLPASACQAILGVEGAALAEAGKGCIGGVGDDEHVTTTPTVTAVGPTIGNVFLVAEADGSAPT